MTVCICDPILDLRQYFRSVLHLSSANQSIQLISFIPRLSILSSHCHTVFCRRQSNVSGAQLRIEFATVYVVKLLLPSIVDELGVYSDSLWLDGILVTLAKTLTGRDRLQRLILDVPRYNVGFLSGFRTLLRMYKKKGGEHGPELCIRFSRGLHGEYPFQVPVRIYYFMKEFLVDNSAEIEIMYREHRIDSAAVVRFLEHNGACMVIEQRIMQ